MKDRCSFIQEDCYTFLFLQLAICAMSLILLQQKRVRAKVPVDVAKQGTLQLLYAGCATDWLFSVSYETDRKGVGRATILTTLK